MNDFEQYLSTKEDAGGHSQQELRAFGAKAAHAYISGDKPLNDSISEFAKTAGLNHEQVKRVVEYANNDTFSHLFKAGHKKNITFPMADSSAIMQMKTPSLKKVASRKVLSLGSYIPGQEYVSLEDAFDSVEPLEKVASAGLSDTEKRKAGLRFSDLKNQHAELDTEVDKLASVFAERLSALRNMCKQASSEGYSASTIASAVEAGAPSKGLKEVIEIDFGDLVLFGHTEKLAMHGMALHQGNPITGLTQDLEGVSGKLVNAQQSMNRVQMSMTELLNVLRGPDPGAGLANHVFNPGGMGSQPAPPPGAAPPQAQPPQQAPQGTPQTPGGPASSELQGLFSGGREGR